MTLPERLGYDFREPGLLREALTHRSFGVPHNERLEFVGDAVLNCVVALALFERFPATQEGDLSRARANLVNRDTHAQQFEVDCRIPALSLTTHGSGSSRRAAEQNAAAAAFAHVVSSPAHG